MKNVDVIKSSRAHSPTIRRLYTFIVLRVQPETCAVHCADATNAEMIVAARATETNSKICSNLKRESESNSE